jgi:UDP-2,3-diacylglucosamine pyrophosphatase LpxH
MKQAIPWLNHQRSTSERLSEVFAEAARNPIRIDRSSKIIFFSDCHRGDNSWADNFAPNQILLFHALNYYFEQGYTYIEVGDGDELWENRDFASIRRAHDHIFWRLGEFHKQQRLYMLWGNHDIERQDPTIVRKQLHQYRDDRTGIWRDLLPDLRMYEGLVLEYEHPNQRIFVVHGHQGSAVNDQYWWFGRLAVRYFWSRLQAFGVKDPTRPSQDMSKIRDVERKIMAWIKEHDNQMVICGHTHRPVFPEVEQTPYFNIGCCVHPRFITGIEIDQGTICLVKWWIDSDIKRPREFGQMFVTRQEIRPAQNLAAYFGVSLQQLTADPIRV